MISMKPTGNNIRGHVLDVSRKPFEEALRFYDPQLYTAWNPKKCGRWGCWEIRRKPEFKSSRWSLVSQNLNLAPHVQGDVFECDGHTIVFPKYHELNIVNHVLDLAYLNYNAIEKLKKMDMWNQEDCGYKGKDLTKVLDYNEAKFEEKIDEKAATERDYNLKQMKSEVRWFKEFVNSGGNPYRLADHWK